jgi:hypothetical protein
LVGAMLSNVSLKQIFDSWGTDKGHAQYPGVYECLFRSCREQVTAVLEVGIGTMIPGAHSSMQGYVLPGYKPGGSLRAWRDFFVNATIYGLDVQPDTQFDDEERIITRLCDSCDASAVRAVMETQGWPREFDIIIDDGSHYAEDQLSTFTNLFPFLKHNGLYIIEDVVGDNHQHLSNKLVETLAYNPHFVLGPENNMLVILKASRITPWKLAPSDWAWSEPPRPRIEAIRILDMSASNSWAEFAALFCNTREAFLDRNRMDQIPTAMGARCRWSCSISIGSNRLTTAWDITPVITWSRKSLTYANSRSENPIIARFGGEEFLILLPETELAAAQRVAERLRRKVERVPFLSLQRPSMRRSALGLRKLIRAWIAFWFDKTCRPGPLHRKTPAEIVSAPPYIGFQSRNMVAWDAAPCSRAQRVHARMQVLHRKDAAPVANNRRTTRLEPDPMSALHRKPLQKRGAWHRSDRERAKPGWHISIDVVKSSNRFCKKAWWDLATRVWHGPTRVAWRCPAE